MGPNPTGAASMSMRNLAWNGSVLLQVLLWTCACSTTPVSNRTEIERQADEALVARVREAFRNDLIYDDHIDVTADRGVVHLSGVVSYADNFSEIWRISRSVPGLKGWTSDLTLVDRR